MSHIDLNSESVKPKILPCRFNLLKAENLNKVVKTRSDGICELRQIYDENRICDDCLRYIKILRSKKYALANHSEKVVEVPSPAW